jgi:hypothetical protein
MNKRHAASVALIMCSTVAFAQTQAEVDALKLRADMADHLKRESEAKKAIAENELATASAAERARVANQKGGAEADKAVSDYYKSLFPTAPDPSKYKVAVPGVPAVAATTSKMTLKETEHLMPGLTGAIQKALTTARCTKKERLVFSDEVKVRSLLNLYRVTNANLEVTAAKIARDTGALKELIDPTIALAGGLPAALIPAALTSLAEVAVSFATILKTQHASSSTSLQTMADEILTAKVVGALHGTSNIKWIEPDSILVIVPEITAASPQDAKAPGLVQHLQKVRVEIAAARKTVTDAEAKVKELRASAPAPKNDKDKKGAAEQKKVLDHADNLEKTAKALAAVADEADKIVLALFMADAQGGTPFDAGLRGGVLNDRMQTACMYLISTKVVAANYDTYAADSLFRGFRAAVSSQTIVRYKVSNEAGEVLTSDAVGHGTPLQRVELPR